MLRKVYRERERLFLYTLFSSSYIRFLFKTNVLFLYALFSSSYIRFLYFFCLARFSFRLFPNFRWDALWGIYSDVILPYLTLPFKELGLDSEELRSLPPGSMCTLWILLLNLSIPDVPFPVPLSTLIRSRFQAKPATLLIPIGFPFLFAVEELYGTACVFFSFSFSFSILIGKRCCNPCELSSIDGVCHSHASWVHITCRGALLPSELYAQTKPFK